MSVDLAAAIRVEQITSTYKSADSLSALERIADQWQSLWQHCVTATPFQSRHWLLPWWKYFGSDHLWTLAVWADERLVGLAPFFIWVPPDSRERRLLLIGTGISDYLDILIDPDWREPVREAIISELTNQSHLWDLCDFQELRPDSLLLSMNLLATPQEQPQGRAGCPHRAAPTLTGSIRKIFLPSTWTDNISPQSVCPILDLTLEAHAPMLKKARYYHRHASKIGELEIEDATSATFEACFQTLMRLHDRRWQHRGGSKAVDHDKLEAFHREAARSFLNAGLLRLHILKLSARPIAALYGFEAKQRVYYYLGGFDPEFSKLSPGAILIAHAIDQSIASGAKHFDFLRGQEDYKYQWGAEGRRTRRRIIRNQ